MTDDPYAGTVARLEAAVLDGAGVLAPETRRAIASGGDAPVELEDWVELVATAAYRTTDGDLAAVTAAVGEDGAFEATVAAALGAARRRLDAALALLEER